MKRKEKFSRKTKFENLSKRELEIEFARLMIISKLDPYSFTKEHLEEYAEVLTLLGGIN